MNAPVWARRLLIALWAFALSGALRAQDASALRVGMWVTVKGTLVGESEFRVEKVEVGPPGDENVLTGTVQRMRSPTRFVLLGQEVRVDSATRWRGIAAGDVSGVRLKVEGDYKSNTKLVAEVISRREPGRDAIEGRIDSLSVAAGVVRMKILHYDCRVPLDAEVEFETPPDQIELAPERTFTFVPTSQRDEDDAVRRLLSLGEVRLGGVLEYEFRERFDQDLDNARPDDRIDTQASLRLEAFWEPGEQGFLLFQLRAQEQRRIDEDDPDERRSELRIGEAYGYWRNALGSGWDVQVGRQDFDERREWVYDQELDGLRLIRSAPNWRVELSATTILSNATQADQDKTNLIAYLSNNDFERQLAAYVVTRLDRRDESAATHIGLRAWGPMAGGLEGWGEVAWLEGEDALGARRRGQGLDLGLLWPLYERRVWLVAGFAWGSGADGADGTFRQTGIADNTDAFGGVTTFRYYGEMFDPELSNMSIATLGVGARIAPQTSLDLVWHRYDQVEALASLVETGIRRTPNGVNRALGWELDLVLGSRAIPGLPIEAVLGWFDPGAALPGEDPAWVARLQLRYQF